MVLLGISLVVSDVESFFLCTCCPLVCLLWENVHLGPLLIVILFLIFIFG